MNLSSVGSALLLFAVVLALVSAPTAAIIFGGAGLVFELILFYLEGTSGV